MKGLSKKTSRFCPYRAGGVAGTQVEKRSAERHAHAKK